MRTHAVCSLEIKKSPLLPTRMTHNGQGSHDVTVVDREHNVSKEAPRPLIEWLKTIRALNNDESECKVIYTWGDLPQV